MEGRFDRDHDEDASTPTTTPENTADSPPISADEAAEEIYAPSPKKSRRGAHKRVVTVPLGDGDGYRSKTEVYPPPDSWSWRKYGQKPIKGSPYPRGYYRCSSSKGCPARKQVERSRMDPTSLLVTYSCEHNHALPSATKNNHHHAPPPARAKPASPLLLSPSAADTIPKPAGKVTPEKSAAADVKDIEPEQEPADIGLGDVVGELGWLCDVGQTMMDGMTLVGTSWANADVELFMPIGEEDKLLFGDLGDLPEYSVGFRRGGVETCCSGTR